MPICVILASLRSFNVLSYAKPVKFRSSRKNCSVLHDMRNGKAMWRLLSITVCAVLLFSKVMKNGVCELEFDQESDTAICIINRPILFAQMVFERHE